ncbi:hypothetical protein PHLGIDRAFT_121875 [Phlebiopsis gigantea 11061_1 CR5-6]|uniref:HMG box domain-containing protein n=1 Tax=Phlebiopsis gigantea (strain 11061_1 CR5-6) TaxID=745531 RepID=A0A0C3S1F5_PHLG1|nr:hypothetical protein PHLGIDRAFT_121875 [Phlebiopsis gigantea 11061_1 CR5-6]
MPALRTRDTASRTLEVITTTDEPLTPTLAILSPTPRAFTFPKHDPPFASPSSSPFEPDLKSIASTPPPHRAFSPTSSIGSETSSLFSTPSTAPSSHVSHRRRRSTVSDNERRPKRGDDDYIKRPENAFILFRRKCCEDRQQALDDADESAPPVKKQRQADLSKAISQQWKSLPDGERQYWEDLAKEKKKAHEQMYPNYVYRPQRVKKAKKGKGKRDEGDAEGGISFVVPVPSPPRSLSRDAGSISGRRACSAPTPPPAYQTIQLPTVYMPSCPPSPTGIPRISRRASYVPPPNDADPSTSFEYMPHNAVLPPSFQRPQFDAMPYDSFQTFSFDAPTPFPGRTNGVPLHSLSIPREPQGFDLVSPADSIASSLSPASSRGSHCGPFTPADLSMTALSLRGGAPECVPADVDADGGSVTAELGYGGYSSGGGGGGGWGWPDAGEMLLEGDFDLSSIPPVELGTTLPDQNGFDGEEAPYLPEHDPFAGLFAYAGGGGGGGAW